MSGSTLAAWTTTGCMASAEPDCEMLIRSLGIRSQAELLDLIEQAVPAQHRSPAAAYFAADRLDNAYRSRRGR